ncbi:hypothetical protein EDD18DRAFT_1179819 [Armillaria luteobubalina]|uniref:HAT C-terminal dimerisation domain-containing protein n=1 Tax=Armillaria luteobubalina TaxID=153913 RepID=A0AA39Q079_9AGAR|nr:hypothetical protein EDD18DRAFT_1179819 [Armillaria luteobubalina]
MLLLVHLAFTSTKTSGDLNCNLRHLPTLTQHLSVLHSLGRWKMGNTSSRMTCQSLFSAAKSTLNHLRSVFLSKGQRRSRLSVEHLILTIIAT